MLRVIGAGFGRTGTDSMREALNILGVGPCHHMMEVNRNPVQKERWRTFVKTSEGSWPELFEGYRSCVDWPAAYYWRELSALYPGATVLLTWRTPESWWTSFEATIKKMVEDPQDVETVGYQIVHKVFGPGRIERDRAIAIYEQNVAEVKATVPPGRLLVYKIGDGWEPLCAHLGLPVPDVPYPHRNTTAEMLARHAEQQQQQQQ